jgi:hypothetical protein
MNSPCWAVQTHSQVIKGISQKHILVQAHRAKIIIKQERSLPEGFSQEPSFDLFIGSNSSFEVLKCHHALDLVTMRLKPVVSDRLQGERPEFTLYVPRLQDIHVSGLALKVELQSCDFSLMEGIPLSVVGMGMSDIVLQTNTPHLIEILLKKGILRLIANK